MPTVEDARTRLAALKAEGRTESTSKEAAKMAQIVAGERSATPAGSSGFDMPKIDYGGITGSPEAGKQLESIVSPLQERYSALLDQITQREKAAVSGATLTQARELGRRGVSSTSGLGERTIQEAVQPVQAQYGALAAQTGISQEQGIQSAIQSYLQQQEDNRRYEQEFAQGQQLSPMEQLVQSILARQQDTGAGSGAGQTSSQSPLYTPMQGNGATSEDGQWIYRNGQWVKKSEVPAPNWQQFAGLDELSSMFK